MGTLAMVLAGSKIRTSEDRFWADVEGDIENVNNVLKITEIRVSYHIRVPKERVDDVNKAFSSYLISCPGAQSVIGCIDIKDTLVLEKDL